MMQGVTEDTPLWDEDDALDEAEKQAATGKPSKGGAAAAKQVPAATGAVVPSAKKAKAKAAAAKTSEEAAAVSPRSQPSSICQPLSVECVEYTADQSRGTRKVSDLKNLRVKLNLHEQAPAHPSTYRVIKGVCPWAAMHP